MNANPQPERMVVLERGTEPFSGLPMLWIGGLLPDVPFDDSGRVEAYFDGVLKSWLPLRRLEPPTDEMAPGSAFDLQVIDEPDVERVRVVLVIGASRTTLADERLEEVHRRLAHGVTAPPPLPPTRAGRLHHLARRAARKMKSGEVLRPRKWGQWSKRLARKVLCFSPPAPVPAPPPTDPLAYRYTPRTAYAAHCDNNDLTYRQRQALAAEVADFNYRPTISILMPVYNVELRWLRAAIDSVREQIYPHWQLCVADDASTQPELGIYLRSLADDSHIKVAFRRQNGHICRATNTAADMATGEFVAFMDNDDALAPDALFRYVRELQEHPETDIIYSDEDKIDADDCRYDPQFKPDWSPELLLSYNYVNHFTCMRRSLFEMAGRLRPGYEGGQDYDLLLRATELTDRIRHVPRVLYHWRSLPTSTAAAASVKPIMFTSCEQALRDRLARMNLSAKPTTPPFAERLRLPISVLDFADDGPSVAILAFDEPETPIDLGNYRNATIVPVRCEAGESKAACLNRIVAQRPEEFILVLDSELVPTDPFWLTRLIGYAQIPGVGCAGPRVIDADGRVLHAGLVSGMHDETAPGRAFAGLPADAISYYFLAEVARNVSALPGDCLITRRSTWLDLGGLDAVRFPSDLWAADYCRRLAERGQRTVCLGHVEMRRNGPARERDDPREVRELAVRHGRGRDPFYNPNLSNRHSFEVVPSAPQRPAMAPGSRARVLFAAHNLSATEGAPRYLFDIAAGLKARGRVEPIVYSPMPGPGADWYDQCRIPVRVGRLPHAGRFLEPKWKQHEYGHTMEQLAALLADVRPEVVVANTLGNFPMVEAAARAGIPSVWIIHESYTDVQMAALHSHFALHRCRASFALADRALIASHATARLFADFDLRRTIEVIHNGLEAAAIEEFIAAVSPTEAKLMLDEPPGRKRLTAVGTVCERKGQHTLVEAAAILRRRGRDDFLVALVGVRDTSLSYVNYIRALIDRERLHDFVALIPETNDVRPYWRASDVFVCASHVEAFSRSMLEAEAFGLPIVSTPCCGADEQVVWGHNAFRFDFSDSRHLAGHLENLLADDAVRRRMASASRAVYECHLTNEHMLDRYERLILNVAMQAQVAVRPSACRAA